MENTNYKVLATKVSTEAYQQINMLAEKAGIKVYNLLQIIVESYITTCFEKSEVINEYAKELLLNFTNISNSKNTFCFCAPNNKNLTATKMFLFVSAQNKNTPGILQVVNKSEGCLETTYNKDIILQTFLSSFAPNILEKLEQIKDRNKTNTLFSALYNAVENELIELEEPLHKEIEDMFAEYEDAEIQQDLGKYRRTMSRDMETMGYSTIEIDPEQTAPPLEQYQNE